MRTTVFIEVFIVAFMITINAIDTILSLIDNVKAKVLFPIYYS